MKNVVIFFIQMAVISSIYLLSELFLSAIHIDFPASVFGMVILFLLLCSGVIRVKYVEKAAYFFNKHLSLFFIPFAVGLMNYGGLIKSSGLQILIMIISSLIVGLVITGGITQFLTKKEKEKSDQHNSY